MAIILEQEVDIGVPSSLIIPPFMEQIQAEIVTLRERMLSGKANFEDTRHYGRLYNEAKKLGCAPVVYQ
jgi:hypothetical protein